MTTLKLTATMLKQPLLGKICDGGRICSAPKECCTLGCCYHHPPPSSRMFNLLFLGHWYFWAIVTACIVCLLCFCSFWKRFKSAFCCFSNGRDDRASEPDSTGSYYAPPQYSRCNSFHHAPPPYNEVTSKPDLYPLVISYNGDTGMKRGGSASYLMVQYFRNYILRPSGSLSATSTLDSLSSSYICNAANTIVPPPYSCTGSLDGFSITNAAAAATATAADQTCNSNDHQQHHQQNPSDANTTGASPLPRSPSEHSLNSNTYYSIRTSSNNVSTIRTSPKLS